MRARTRTKSSTHYLPDCLQQPWATTPTSEPTMLLSSDTLRPRSSAPLRPRAGCPRPLSGNPDARTSLSCSSGWHHRTVPAIPASISQPHGDPKPPLPYAPHSTSSSAPRGRHCLSPPRQRSRCARRLGDPRSCREPKLGSTLPSVAARATRCRREPATTALAQEDARVGRDARCPEEGGSDSHPARTASVRRLQTRCHDP